MDIRTMFSLSGKVAVVGGASRGIGWGLAVGLAQAGAAVTGFGRSAGIQSDGFRYCQCDMTDAPGVTEMFTGVEREFGRIDVYLHVAGITFPSEGSMQSDEVFAATINQNLTAAYRCCADAGRRMSGTGGGSIVAVTSIGSMLAFPNNPGYVAAKGGLRMMSKALALDLGPSKVRVNCLVPGYIRTAMTANSYDDVALREKRTERTMLGRWGGVEDLVGAAVFLSSDASTYITGTDLVVDGGWTAKGL